METLFELGDRPLSGMFSRDAGRPRTVFSVDGEGESVRVEIAPLDSGVWTTLFESQDAGTRIIVMRGANAWFIAMDGRGDERHNYHFWRSDAAGVVEIGQSDDPVIEDVAYRFGWNGAPLTPGDHGYGLTCEGYTCRSKRVDMAPFAVTPIGEVSVPEPEPPLPPSGLEWMLPMDARWLACGAADVIVRQNLTAVPDDTNLAERGLYWSVRVPGLARLP